MLLIRFRVDSLGSRGFCGRVVHSKNLLKKKQEVDGLLHRAISNSKFHSLKFLSLNSSKFEIPMTRLLIFTLAATLAFSLVTSVQARQQQDEKTTLFNKYEESKEGGAEQQKVAYETAREYLQKFPADDQNAQAMRKFVAAYEKLLELDRLLKARDYAKVLELGRERLTVEPANFFVLTKMVEEGFNSAQTGDTTFRADAIVFARKALELLDSGKVKDPSPLATIDAARAFHNIALATLLLDTSPDEASTIFLKVLQLDEYKKEPSLYYYFGRALLKGDYQRLTSEFKQKYEGKAATPDSKALLEQVNHVVERIVDAYARAVALSTAPEQEATKNQVLPQLTAVYKALHNNSDAGLPELIGNVLSKPMP